MSLATEWMRRLQMLLNRRQFSSDLEEEMRLHLDLLRQQGVESGVSAEESRRAASRKFGNATYFQEQSYIAWGWEWLESLAQDSLYGIRSLLRSPALTLVALLSLALGIGANTAIFGLMDAVMLRSLPVKHPEQLVVLGEARSSGVTGDDVSTELYAYPFFQRLRQNNQVFSDTGAVFSMLMRVHGYLDGRSDSEVMNVQLISGSYFPTLGVESEVGRLLNDEDDSSEGNHPVAVVSYNWWKRSLARDPNILNRKVKLGTTIFAIVGVAPPEFFGTEVGTAPDVWIPMAMLHSIAPHWGGYSDPFTHSLYLMGRLKPGVSKAQASSNLNLLFQQLTHELYGATLRPQDLEKLNRTVVPLTSVATGISGLRREYSAPLKILMTVVALVLLIACANIANLLLARSTARAREFAVRQALGARRVRLIRQLLTESLILALIGGALGIAFAAVANRVLLRIVSGGFETLPLNVGVDLRLLGFTFGVAVATAVLFGIIPAFRATRVDPIDSLKEGRGGSGAIGRTRTAKTLIIAQVAVSLVLTVASSLFLRSLVNLNNVNTGFNRENVLRLQLDTDTTGYPDDDPRLNVLFQEIESRVSALPGVKAASFSAFTFHEGSWSDGIHVPGMKIDENIAIHQNVVGDGYFETMQIPILAGRRFGPQDTASSQHVAVISELMAKNMFPAGNPIGLHFRVGDDKPENDYEVIGIAGDVKFRNLQGEPSYINYLHYTQRPWRFGDFEVRYTGDFNAVANEVRQTIRAIDHNLLVNHVTTLEEQVSRTITNQRLVAELSVFFAMLAVFLSCIGVYGLMSYIVNRRTNEIGVRMALGAARSAVAGLVMRESAGMILTGVAIGIPVALLSGKLVVSMLYGIESTDLISLGGAGLLLILVAVLAGYFPARRASKVEPMSALRYE